MVENVGELIDKLFREGAGGGSPKQHTRHGSRLIVLPRAPARVRDVAPPLLKFAAHIATLRKWLVGGGWGAGICGAAVSAQGDVFSASAGQEC